MAIGFSFSPTSGDSHPPVLAVVAHAVRRDIRHQVGRKSVILIRFCDHHTPDFASLSDELPILQSTLQSMVGWTALRWFTSDWQYQVSLNWTPIFGPGL